MRVQQVSYTRVKSDRVYGNRQATVVMLVDEGEDPVAAMAEARCQAEQAVSDDFGYAVASFQAPEDLTDYIEDDKDDDPPYRDMNEYDGPIDDDAAEAAGDDVGAGATP